MCCVFGIRLLELTENVCLVALDGQVVASDCITCKYRSMSSFFDLRKCVVEHVWLVILLNKS